MKMVSFFTFYSIFLLCVGAAYSSELHVIRDPMLLLAESIKTVEERLKELSTPIKIDSSLFNDSMPDVLATHERSKQFVDLCYTRLELSVLLHLAYYENSLLPQPFIIPAKIACHPIERTVLSRLATLIQEEALLYGYSSFKEFLERNVSPIEHQSLKYTYHEEFKKNLARQSDFFIEKQTEAKKTYNAIKRGLHKAKKKGPGALSRYKDISKSKSLRLIETLKELLRNVPAEEKHMQKELETYIYNVKNIFLVGSQPEASSSQSLNSDLDCEE